jgi:hypothetical protein
MSGHYRIAGPVKIIDGESGASDFTSEALDCENINQFTLLFWWEGGSSPVGEFKVDGLRDEGPRKGSQEWQELSVSPALTVTGTSGQLDAVLSGPLRKYRIRYERTSGDATIYCSYTGKSY